MKVFALGGIRGQDQWLKLADEINLQIARLDEMNHSTGKQANVEIHRESGLLIVLGNPSELEAAESLVAAWRANYPVPPPARP
jgi:hypothetical protein